MKLLAVISILMILAPYETLAQDDVIDNEVFNKAVGYYNMGKTQYDLQKFDAAIKFFSMAHILNSSNSDYTFGLANSYYDLGLYDSALKYIEQTIDLAVDQPDYHYRAGNIHFHLKQYAKAKDNYQIALNNLNDEYPINIYICTYNKAVSEYQIRNFEEAITDLTKLIELDSAEMKYRHLRGVCYLKSGDDTNACEDFTVALDLGNQSSAQYLDRYCN
ncbi:MAG: tetratricopeptide repeat protein [Bacteroidota bacterium]